MAQLINFALLTVYAIAGLAGLGMLYLVLLGEAQLLWPGFAATLVAITALLIRVARK
jgi:hypothetical protein